MIRYNYINNQILHIYSMLSDISFPLNINQVLQIIPDCKYMSYQKFAEINNCSINDVINLCESKSGCTHYDISQNRYLILCNQSTSENNTIGRQRWTCCHEIGHIVCKHLVVSAHTKLAENNLTLNINPEYEAEADYFAAMLLAPFPLFKLLNIHTPDDIKKIFGLSNEASQYRYKQYTKWIQSRIKTAWENDMIRVYRRMH